MTQEFGALDTLVRKRIRGLRIAMGWSLDELASRCYLSASTLSRIETGNRRIGLDQLAAIARGLGTTLDQLVESESDDDVIIRARHDAPHNMTAWPMRRDPGTTVARMRVTNPPPAATAELRAHPGREWFAVLSGTVVLALGDRRITVETDQAAEFSTMIPHAIGARGGPADVIGIFDAEGRRTHLDTPRVTGDR